MQMAMHHYEDLIRAGLTTEEIRTWPAKSLWLVYMDYQSGILRPMKNNGYSPASAGWDFLRQLFPDEFKAIEERMSDMVMAKLQGSGNT